MTIKEHPSSMDCPYGTYGNTHVLRGPWMTLIDWKSINTFDII